MKYIVEIKIENAAFAWPARETARILRELADSITEENGLPTKKLLDINGNPVGQAEYKRTRKTKN